MKKTIIGGFILLFLAWMVYPGYAQGQYAAEITSRVEVHASIFADENGASSLQITASAEAGELCLGVPTQGIDLLWVMSDSLRPGYDIDWNTYRQPVWDLTESLARISTDSGGEINNRISFVFQSGASESLSQFYDANAFVDLPITEWQLSDTGSLEQAFSTALARMQDGIRPDATPVVVIYTYSGEDVTANLLQQAANAASNGTQVLFLLYGSMDDTSISGVLGQVQTAGLIGIPLFSVDDVVEAQSVLWEWMNSKHDKLASNVEARLYFDEADKIVLQEPSPVLQISDTGWVWQIGDLSAQEARIVEVPVNADGVDNISGIYDVSYRDCSGFIVTEQGKKLIPYNEYENGDGDDTDKIIGWLDKFFEFLDSVTEISKEVPPLLRDMRWLVLALRYAVYALFILGLVSFAFRLFRPKKTHKKRAQIEALPDAPLWVQKVTNTLSGEILEEHKSADDLSEIIVISIGGIAKQALKHYVSYLDAYFGEKTWKKKIKVVQIDVDLKKYATSKRPAWLDSEQWALLQGNIQEIQTEINAKIERETYWQWYADASHGKRYLGRTMLFADLLRGPLYSGFWSKVANTYKDVDHPRVCVLGATVDSISSSMLVDMAYLVSQGILRRDMDVELWLIGPLAGEISEIYTGESISVEEQQKHHLATLRELELFQAHALRQYQYVPNSSRFADLNQTFEHPVVQTVLLFEGSNDGLNLDELSVRVADRLWATSYQDMGRCIRKDMKRNVHKSGVSTIGHYVRKQDLSPLEEKMFVWKAVQDALFDQQIGLFPFLSLPAAGDLTGIETQPINWQDERRLIRRWLQYWQDGEDEDFVPVAQNIARRLGQLLNGEVGSEVYPLGRRDGWASIVRWIELVKEESLDYSISLRKIESLLAHWKRDLRNLQQVMEQYQENIAEQLGGILQNLRQETIIDERSGRQISRAEMAEQLYLESIRGKSDNFTHKTLYELVSHLGWYTWYDEKEERLVSRVLFHEKPYQRQTDLREYLVTPGRMVEILHDAATRTIRLRSKTPMVEIVSQEDLQYMRTKLIPPLTYSIHAIDGAANIEDRYYIGVQHTARDEVAVLHKKFVNDVAGNPELVEVCAIEDPAVVHFLHWVNGIQFSHLASFSESHWRAQRPQPKDYVWEDMQWAARVEMNSPTRHRLSPRFIGYYQQYKTQIRDFPYLILHSQWAYSGNKLHIHWGDERSHVANGWFDLLQFFVEDDRAADWQSLARQARQRRYDPAHLRNAKREIEENIDDALRSEDRDVCTYLWYVWDCLQKPYDGRCVNE